MAIVSTDKPQIAGILLAAGNSSRMGEPKALLDFKGSTFIDTILNHLYQSGCDPVMSILGSAGDMICKCTNVNQYECYSNPAPEKGMLSSLKVAIKKLPEHCDGFILALVDHPAVRASTYIELIRTARQNPNRIIIPKFFGSKGHPVFFGKRFFDDLMKTPEGEGARLVVHQQMQNVHFLDVDDEGILFDIDTPQELNKWTN